MHKKKNIQFVLKDLNTFLPQTKGAKNHYVMYLGIHPRNIVCVEFIVVRHICKGISRK